MEPSGSGRGRAPPISDHGLPNATGNAPGYRPLAAYGDLYVRSPAPREEPARGSPAKTGRPMGSPYAGGSPLAAGLINGASASHSSSPSRPPGAAGPRQQANAAADDAVNNAPDNPLFVEPLFPQPIRTRKAGLCSALPLAVGPLVIAIACVMMMCMYMCIAVTKPSALPCHAVTDDSSSWAIMVEAGCQSLEAVVGPLLEGALLEVDAAPPSASTTLLMHARMHGAVHA